MVDVEIIEFHPKHLEIAKLREEEIRTLIEIKDAYKKIESFAAASRQAVTMLCAGRIITIAGFIQVCEGVGEVWQIPTLYVSQHTLLYSKTLRGYVETIAKTFKYHRLQTICPADSLHERWMKFLKFEREGTMKQYTAFKTDYHMYARLFSWA